MNMRILVNSAITTAGAAFTALSFTTVLTALPSQMAHAWWACDNNFDIEHRNSNTQVRCVDTKPYTCPKVSLPGTNVQVGTNPVERAGLDTCRALQSTIDFPYVCPAGYGQNPRPGRDNCFQEKAPNRNV
jgi:hypothetical protein